MLGPIKATGATTATEATEPSSAVTPISEQRPGQTLRDRLFKGAEISGGAKPSASGSTNNSPSLYQQYSVAKTLPATPITPTLPAAATSTFSTMAGQYSNYKDFMSAMGAFQKPAAQQEYVHWSGGEGFVDPSLLPYISRYGSIKGLEYIKSLKAADDLQASRQNPYYQPLMSKDMDTYFDTTGDQWNAQSLSAKYGTGIIGGQETRLDKGEIDTLRNVARDNGLGESGFQDLLSKTYKMKTKAAADAFLPKIQNALTNPYSANWDEITSGIGVQTNFKLSDIDGLSERIKMIGMDAANLPAGVTGASLGGLAATGLGLSTGLPAAFLPYLGPAAAIAGAAVAAIAIWSHGQKEKLENANFSAIKNGKLATSINDYSGSEKDNIKQVADGAGIKVEDFIKALGTLQSVSLYDRGKSLESLSGKYGGEGDGAVVFGGGGVSLSKTYNPYVKNQSAEQTAADKKAQDEADARNAEWHRIYG